MKTFVAHRGTEIDATGTMYPSLLQVIGGAEALAFADSPPHRTSTLYLYVLRGTCAVYAGGEGKPSFALPKGWFFSAPASEVANIHGYGDNPGDFAGVLIERFGYRGQWQVGKVEQRGRLSYIDGCSDSMLVYPARLGDPVLNHLHFPPGIKQTQHTHPSIRLGIVIGGRGKAWREAGPNSEGWELDLVEGNIFMLEEQELHSFQTFDSPMDIIAFHPDSDWGPTDATHPMLNRTYINFGK